MILYDESPYQVAETHFLFESVFKCCNKYYHCPYFTREKTSLGSLSNLAQITQLMSGEDNFGPHLASFQLTRPYCLSYPASK